MFLLTKVMRKFLQSAKSGNIYFSFTFNFFWSCTIQVPKVPVVHYIVPQLCSFAFFTHLCRLCKKSNISLSEKRALIPKETCLRLGCLKSTHSNICERKFCSVRRLLYRKLYGKSIYCYSTSIADL